MKPLKLELADMTERECVYCFIMREGCISDYYHDLNACAEFEATLTHDEWRIYLGFVMGASIIPRLASMEGFHKAWIAKPPRRCEAFLRVRGKLKE